MLRVAIISPFRNKYSETFIHNQVENLPASVFHLYGGYLPLYYNKEPFIGTKATAGLLHRWAFPVIKRKLEKQVARFLKNNNIDVILAHYGPSGVMMESIAQVTGIPLAVYYHGYDIYRKYELKRFGNDYKSLFQEAAAVFCVSRDMEKDLLNAGVAPEKLHYNPCGANVDLFSPVSAGENPEVAVFVGRFSATKGPDLTIKAFKRVAEQLSTAKLVMIGDGPLLNRCRRLAESLLPDHQIEFRGVLPHKEVAQVMSESRLYVQHSVVNQNGEREGTPVAVLEAAASGLPIVSTKHAGIKDVVQEGITGFLVDEKDVEQMSEKMLLLLQNKEQATNMGNAGHHRVARYFSLDKHLHDLHETLLGLVK